jgi:hypothetical protein
MLKKITTIKGNKITLVGSKPIKMESRKGKIYIGNNLSRHEVKILAKELGEVPSITEAKIQNRTYIKSELSKFVGKKLI